MKKILKSKISLATVYNTVHAFKNNGYLKEISLQGNKTFFDTNSKVIIIFMIKIQGDLMDIKNEDISISKFHPLQKEKKLKK